VGSWSIAPFHIRAIALLESRSRPRSSNGRVSRAV
jgi:hypothetical protein